MKVISFKNETNLNRNTLTSEIQINGNISELTISYDQDVCGKLKFNEVANYVALLPVAMANNSDLLIECEIERGLLRNLQEWVDAYAEYFPVVFNRIKVTASRIVDAVEINRKNAPNDRVGMFFSGGIDSLHVIHEHTKTENYLAKDSMAFLIPIVGMDLESESTVELVLETAKTISNEKSFYVLPIYSNIKQFLISNTNADWALQLHGIAKACIAMALSDEFKHISLGSAGKYGEITFEGSMPGTDELFRTRNFQLFHVGAKASRMDKIRELLEWELFPKLIRVCFDESRQLNCGMCGKCTRTIFCIDSLGYKERFLSSFEPNSFENLDKKLGSLWTNNHSIIPLFKEIAVEYKKSGNDKMSKIMFKWYKHFFPSKTREYLRYLASKISLYPFL